MAKTAELTGGFPVITRIPFVYIKLTVRFPALENLDRVLTGFGVTRSQLAYVEIYLTNPQEHFETCIGPFKEYMGQHRPASTLLGVTHLAFPNQLIEISAVAHTG